MNQPHHDDENTCGLPDPLERGVIHGTRKGLITGFAATFAAMAAIAGAVAHCGPEVFDDDDSEVAITSQRIFIQKELEEKILKALKAYDDNSMASKEKKEEARKLYKTSTTELKKLQKEQKELNREQLKGLDDEVRALRDACQRFCEIQNDQSITGSIENMLFLLDLENEDASLSAFDDASSDLLKDLQNQIDAEDTEKQDAFVAFAKAMNAFILDPKVKACSSMTSKKGEAILALQETVSASHAIAYPKEALEKILEVLYQEYTTVPVILGNVSAPENSKAQAFLDRIQREEERRYKHMFVDNLHKALKKRYGEAVPSKEMLEMLSPYLDIDPHEEVRSRRTKGSLLQI